MFCLWRCPVSAPVFRRVSAKPWWKLLSPQWSRETAKQRPQHMRWHSDCPPMHYLLKLSWVSARYAVIVPSITLLQDHENDQIQICWVKNHIRSWTDKSPKLRQANIFWKWPIWVHFSVANVPSRYLLRFQGNWTLGSTEALGGRPRESLPQCWWFWWLAIQGMMEDW